MSSLLKKFTSDNSDTRNARGNDDLNGYQRPRDFIPQQPPVARTIESNRTNLCSDVEIKGSISFKEYLRLDGKFEGELRSPGTLVIGENGVVKAELQVGNLILEGSLYGNVTAQDKIELRATAQLFGDIKASRLIISEGVVFVGKSDVNPGQKIEKLSTASTPGSELQLESSEQSSPARDSLY